MAPQVSKGMPARNQRVVARCLGPVSQRTVTQACGQDLKLHALIHACPPPSPSALRHSGYNWIWVSRFGSKLWRMYFAHVCCSRCCNTKIELGKSRGWILLRVSILALFGNDPNDPLLFPFYRAIGKWWESDSVFEHWNWKAWVFARSCDC